MPDRKSLDFVSILTILNATLLLVVSIAGLLFGEKSLYVLNPVTLPQLYGQDAMTLVVGLPLLLGSMRAARQGAVRGLLLWMGALFYVAYSYFFYVVGVQFNVLFPAYIAIVSTALYGLLSLLFGTDRDRIKSRFHGKTPVRLISGFLIAMSSFVTLMWADQIISALVAGTDLDPVTRQVIVLDGVVLLPLMFVGGLRLWRRSAWGYVLGGVLLVKLATLGLTLVVNTFLVSRWGQEVVVSQAVVFTAVLIGSIFCLVPYLRSVDSSRAEDPDDD